MMFFLIPILAIFVYYGTLIKFIITESDLDFSTQVTSQTIPNTETMCKGGWVEIKLMHHPLSLTNGLSYGDWLPDLAGIGPVYKWMRKLL